MIPNYSISLHYTLNTLINAPSYFPILLTLLEYTTRFIVIYVSVYNNTCMYLKKKT